MIGSKIREFRRTQHMSQKELGEMMGVSGTAVHKWEHDVAQPDIPTLRKLAMLFGVTLDQLCEMDNTADEQTLMNTTLVTKAFRSLTAEEQKQYIEIGRLLFGKAFKK